IPWRAPSGACRSWGSTRGAAARRRCWPCRSRPATAPPAGRSSPAGAGASPPPPPPRPAPRPTRGPPPRRTPHPLRGTKSVRGRAAVGAPYTRRAFGDHLIQTLAREERQGGRLALLLLDIDHFKKLNDTFGHPAGDAALKNVADTLQHHLRKGDQAARYGGE